MKKIVSIVLVLALVAAFCAGCSSDKKTIKVGASSTPHAEILESVKDDLAKDGWKLEVVRLDWDSLVPAVQTGKVDAVIAGQSMTEERMQQVDFAGPYLYASIVCMTKQNSKYANATSLADLAGAKCTSQLGTIWYTTCLPQINGALIQTAQETAPSMLMALETGAVDFICTDMPTAQGALIAYSDLKILDLPENAFKVDEGDINIGISVKKGNTELKDKINSALAGMTADDFNKIMNEATKIQPLSK